MQRHICVFILPSNFVDTDKLNAVCCFSYPNNHVTSIGLHNFYKGPVEEKWYFGHYNQWRKTLLGNNILIPCGKIILSYVV